MDENRKWWERIKSCWREQRIALERGNCGKKQGMWGKRGCWSDRELWESQGSEGGKGEL